MCGEMEGTGRGEIKGLKIVYRMFIEKIEKSLEESKFYFIAYMY
jgi:hypothetical protein